MPESDEGFLTRWSRRKAEVREGRPVPAAEPPAADTEAALPASEESAAARDGAPGDAERQAAEALENIDIDSLDHASDYTRFMGADVPDALRNKALRKLWDSDPVFGRMDGLDHYIGDYTDEAVALPMGAIQTAYKVGQGFLSDEEAADWDALGHPPKPEPELSADGATTVGDAIVIAPEPPDQPEVIAFLEASDRYHGALYPAESNHLVDVASLAGDDVRFLVMRDDGADGRALGCGAVRIVRPEREEPYGELKRMWIDPARRGGGLGRRLLASLEEEARTQGLAILRLETGIGQPEALALYRNAGFTERTPFGDYREDPLSLFLEKRLS